jgi:hypothetical protein
MYLNFTTYYSSSTPNCWYRGGDNYHKFAFKFSDGAISDWSSFCVHAYDGDRFMCASVPAYSGSGSGWASVVAYCFNYDATSPANDVTNALAYTSAFTSGKQEIQISGTVLGKGSGNGAAELAYTKTDYLDNDKASIWCQDWFLSYTDGPCSGGNYTNLAAHWSYIKNLWNDSTSITTAQQNVFKSSAYQPTTVRLDAGSKFETIGFAKARYNRIISLHSDICEDFVFNPKSGSVILPNDSSQPSSKIILIVLSGMAAVFAAGYLLHHKKRSV